MNFNLPRKNELNKLPIGEWRPKDIFFVVMGVACATIGLKAFLIPNDFVDGGVTGLSLLVRTITDINLSFLIVVFNIPFFILGLRQMGKGFVFKTVIAIVALAAAVYFTDIEEITQDKLLISVFGGLFLGAGVGFSIRGGAVIDGTEILALFLSRKTGIKLGDVILGINIMIFILAAVMIDAETAMYAIITYFCASRTVEFIVQGIEEYTGVTIVSERSNDIRRMIIYGMGRGVTLYKGQRGYGKRGENDNLVDIVFTVVTRLELQKLHAEVKNIDENAFVFTTSINDTKGGIIKKRPLHH